jgi:hypothetical protein
MVAPTSPAKRSSPAVIAIGFVVATLVTALGVKLLLMSAPSPLPQAPRATPSP